MCIYIYIYTYIEIYVVDVLIFIHIISINWQCQDLPLDSCLVDWDMEERVGLLPCSPLAGIANADNTNAAAMMVTLEI